MQFFDFAAQHLLLPALLGCRCLRAVLIPCQLFLAPGQLLELVGRLLHLLLWRIRCCIAAGLVLVLFEIHFEFEHLAEVASCLASAAAIVGLHRYVDVGEDGFGCQQVLQCLLLWEQGFFEVDFGEEFSGWRHCLGCLVQILDELCNFLVRRR